MVAGFGRGLVLTGIGEVAVGRLNACTAAHGTPEDKANRCGWGGLLWVWVAVAGDEFLLGAIGLENAAADGADVAAVDMDGDGGGIGEGIADGVDIAAGG